MWSARKMPRCVLPARGEPEAGESAEQTLTRELGEELGVMPTLLRLGQVEEMAALENVPMRMTVFTARISPDLRPAAELTALGWANGVDGCARLLAPAVSGHVVPLRRSAGLLPGVSTREPGPRITSVVSANSAALPASSCRWRPGSTCGRSGRSGIRVSGGRRAPAGGGFPVHADWSSVGAAD